MVINVTGQTRSLITPLQSTPTTAAEMVPSLHQAQNPAAVSLSLPKQPILPPSQLAIQPLPQFQIQPTSRLPIKPPSLQPIHLATGLPIHQANHPSSQLPAQPVPQLPAQQATGVPIYQVNVLPFQTALNQPVPLRQPIDYLQQNQNSRNDFNIPLQQNQLSPDKMSRYRTATISLFERQCINLLHEKPCSPTGCQYNHNGLPSVDKIHGKMSTFQTDKILFIYQTFIVKYRATFHQYFPMICQLYGSRGGMRQTYESFVADCEKYDKYDYFQYIFGGQLLSGNIDRRTALLLIINCCKTCGASIQAILTIILQDDPQSFIDILIKYATELEPEILNKLLHQVSANVNISQLMACVHLLGDVRGEIVLRINENVLYSFCKVVDASDGNLAQTLFQIMNRCESLR